MQEAGLLGDRRSRVEKVGRDCHHLNSVCGTSCTAWRSALVAGRLVGAFAATSPQCRQRVDRIDRRLRWSSCGGPTSPMTAVELNPVSSCSLERADEVSARVAEFGIGGEVVEKGVGVQKNGRSGWSDRESHDASDGSSSGSMIKHSKSTGSPFQRISPAVCRRPAECRLHGEAHFFVFLERKRLDRFEYAVFVDGFDCKGHAGNLVGLRTT